MPTINLPNNTVVSLSVQELIEYQQAVSSNNTDKSKRRAAALKAWKTRRANKSKNIKKTK